jgi:4-amino-4-deoxy-L-arabinose transferase-like glycosyltransferase
VLVCAFSLFAGLGRAALWEPDEARYAEGTRQMLERGDFLTPWFNGEPRLEKPVLFYWLQMPFFAVLGPGEAAARAPVALLGAASVLMTYLIGARLFGPQVAWMAALVFATSFRPITFARLGHTDMPALFFELVALHAFLRGAQDASARRAWIVAWAAVGLATLTKGPVAAIPVVVWGAYLAVTRDWTGVRRMRLLPGALVAAAIAPPGMATW